MALFILRARYWCSDVSYVVAGKCCMFTVTLHLQLDILIMINMATLCCSLWVRKSICGIIVICEAI